MKDLKEYDLNQLLEFSNYVYENLKDLNMYLLSEIRILNKRLCKLEERSKK